ncbi:MAG: hypothetical protein EAZ92_09760 [Candidatus Kapaibacterium sp.]|nr:MAG: hypothetical protein EAZ92_09760 [Candidatus Kapabacteria bacterium]
MASSLAFNNLSDDALKAHFGTASFNAAQKLLAQGAVLNTEFNISDNVVYGTLLLDGAERNVDMSESAKSGLVWDSDIENNPEAAETAVLAALLHYRNTDEYARRFGSGASSHHGASVVANAGKQKGKKNASDASKSATKATSAKNTKKNVKKGVESTLQPHLEMLSTNELTTLIVQFAESYPEVKRDLLIRFRTNNDEVLQELTKEIFKIFPRKNAEFKRFTATAFMKQLQTLQSSIEQLPRSQQWQPKTELVIGLLELFSARMLNSRRIDDTYEALSKDVRSMNQERLASPEQRHAFLEKLALIVRKLIVTPNYSARNVFHFALEFCLEKEDYNALTKQFLAATNTWEKQGLKPYLEIIFTKTQDKEARIQMLEHNLVGIGDYVQLAKFWRDEENNIPKAIDIAERGVLNVSGTAQMKFTLLQMLSEHYVAEGNYDALLRIFTEHLKNDSNVTVFNAFGMSIFPRNTIGKPETNPLEPFRRTMDALEHPFFSLLLKHFVSTNNDERVHELFRIALEQGKWSIAIIIESKKYLRPADAADIQQKMIAGAMKLLKGNNNYAFSDLAAPLLAGIYYEQGDMEKLWKTIEKNIPEMMKYEETLVITHPAEYVLLYKKHVDRLLKEHRSNYQIEAMQTLRRIRHIQTTVLGQARDWHEYIKNIRESTTKLRNFQAELNKL